MSSHHAHGDGNGEGRAYSLADAELDSEITLPPVLHRFFERTPLEGVRRILDLGSGPGVGTVELSQRCPAATVVGLDVDQAVLARAAERADRAGVGGRIEFVQADFGSYLAALVEPVDLIWASMSLHHDPDPEGVLRRAVDALRPGGRLALAEFGRPLTMWPDTAPPAVGGAWGRGRAAMAEAPAEAPASGPVHTDWLTVLGSAEVEEVEQFECPIRRDAPLGDNDRRWLANRLKRRVRMAGDNLDEGNKASIEDLIDPDNPDGVWRSNDVFIDTSRIIYSGVRKGLLPLSERRDRRVANLRRPAMIVQ